MPRSLAVLAALALTSRVAAADDQLKNPDTALAWSVAGTAASVGVVAIGAQTHNSSLVGWGVLSSLLTPSLGEWYAGKYVTAGMGLRLLGGAVAIAGVAQAFETSCYIDCNSSSSSTSGGGLVLVGLATFAGGTLYDIATARSAARDYNTSHRLTVLPTVLHPPSGPVYGLGVGGRF